MTFIFTNRKLQRLKHQHRRLERLFARHQEALVAQAPRRAAGFLSRYRGLLAAHTAQEEQWLALLQTLDIRTRWPVRVYRAEHKRFTRQVAALEASIRALPDEAMAPARLIELIEREKTLKGLSQHHHACEEEDLYRTLHGVLDAPVVLVPFSPPPAACGGIRQTLR